MWKFLIITFGIAVLYVMLMRDVRMLITGDRLSIPDRLARRRRRRIRALRMAGLVLMAAVSLLLPHYRRWMEQSAGDERIVLNLLPALVLVGLGIATWRVPRWMPDRWEW